MSAPVDEVRLNGTIYSGMSCEFRIDKNEYVGILDVDYNHKLTRKAVPAASKDRPPLGWTTGKYVPPVLTIKVLRLTAQMIKEYLSKIGGGSYGIVSFDFTVSVHEPDVLSKPITLIFDECVIQGEKEGHAEGIDELVTEFSVACLSLSQDKMTLWNSLKYTTAAT